MKNFKCVFSVLLSMLSTATFGASIVDREGSYEINWSSGKIRFYGVGKLTEGDATLRAAEQRAWADGLKLAEKNIPVLFAGRLGPQTEIRTDKLSKLAQSTTSVSTTYFGDQRVKVILEAPISKILPQMVVESNAPTPSAEPEAVILKVVHPANPTAWLRVIDEKGRDLFASAAPRWFKGSVNPIGVGLASTVPVVSGRMKTPGVLQVSAADWRPGFGAAIATGKAAVIVQ